MSDTPASIEDALQLMLKGKSALIQKRLAIYLKQIKKSADKNLEEAEKVVGYIFPFDRK